MRGRRAAGSCIFRASLRGSRAGGGADWMRERAGEGCVAQFAAPASPGFCVEGAGGKVAG
eukprot:1327502-Lingulodinium_polyedra.AAC.1